MNVFECLRIEHRRLRTLLERAQTTTQRTRRSRQTWLEKMRSTVEIHAATLAELTHAPASEVSEVEDGDPAHVRFDAAGDRAERAPRPAAATSPIIEAQDAESSFVRVLLDDLSRIDPDDARWMVNLELFGERLRGVLAREERQLLPRATSTRKNEAITQRGTSLARAACPSPAVRRGLARTSVASLWV